VDNIKIKLNEIGLDNVHWAELTHEKVQWLAVLSIVFILCVINVRNLIIQVLNIFFVTSSRSFIFFLVLKFYSVRQG
jgi:hypothetical protein